MKTQIKKDAFIVTFVISILITNNLSAQESNCNDRIDNDGDGYIDMFDTDCAPTSLGYICSNKFYLTRQITSPSDATVLSSINFAGSDINVNDNKTYSGILLNASFYYNGFLYAFGHTPSSNVLYQLRNNSTTASMTMTGLPSSSWNNAVCTDSGMVYLLQNGTHTLWKINLHTLAVTSNSISGISDSPSNSVWGDMVIDPNTKEIYCWYHPTAASSVRGLYKVNLITNSFTFMGTNTSNTMGSMFFDAVGNLYGYGSSTIGGVQDRFYSLNKTTGATVQFGTPDMQVTQTDGCNCVAAATLLPVELYDFTGIAEEDKTTLLLWKTASELNNDYFEVMRSSDAIQWEAIGKVKGSRNSKQVISYEFKDNHPPGNSINYYRLKQVDLNGQFEYSIIIPVRFSLPTKEKNGNIVMYPNPTNSEIFIKVEDNVNAPLELDMQVYNPFGQNICNIKLDKNVQSVNLSNYPVGMYIFIAGDKLFRIYKE
ncbi:MAG: T9SS type A sorting domain-containing protein [Chitinophagales bacterium]|nr:T9SS type A sorting domain-containing protein [Chitinophagales bacterium]